MEQVAESKKAENEEDDTGEEILRDPVSSRSPMSGLRIKYLTVYDLSLYANRSVLNYRSFFRLKEHRPIYLITEMILHM